MTRCYSSGRRRIPSAATYDGGAPRELMRFEQPFGNHNGGQLAFNPLAEPNSAEFGLLYIGIADGGSGGDPLNLAQNLSSAFGKMLRIDPLGTNSANGKYGIPEGQSVRQRQRSEHAWRDLRRWSPQSAALRMGFAERQPLRRGHRTEHRRGSQPGDKGANLGWNKWEGSYGFISRQAVSLENPRGDSKMTYPIVEYGQIDPLLQSSSAVTMGVVYRRKEIPQLSNLLIFGDNPSGEIFYVSADKLPNGGQDAIRRVLFNDNGEAKTLLQLIKDKNVAQGKTPSTRADLRFGEGPNGEILHSQQTRRGDPAGRPIVFDRGRRHRV